ncbi:MAG: glycosyltransferase family 2 protein, partial [Actinomycetota bacterium]
MTALNDDVDIGVVIVTYNSERLLKDLFGSLPLAIGDLSWRAVVVDNASADETVARVEQAGWCVESMGRNAGYAAGINRGVACLPGARAILVLNPDVLMSPGSVSLLYAALADGVGIAAPQTRGFDGELHLTLRRRPSISRVIGAALLGAGIADRVGGFSETVTDRRVYTTPRDVDWAVGAALLVTRACSDAVGEWDESFFLYSEETDFCERARGAGFRIRYVPNALVRHEGGGGIGQPYLRSMMMVNRVRHFRKMHAAPATFVYW